MTTLLQRSSRLTLRGTALFFQASVSQNRVVASGNASKVRSSLLLGIVSSAFLPARSVTFCEDKGKGFFESIAKKDDNGNTDWAKSVTQVTEAEFWDKIASASGEKVRFNKTVLGWFLLSVHVTSNLSFFLHFLRTDSECL
jgi:hypothetical protein